MNARLPEIEGGRRGETGEEGGNIILGDGQQRGRCSDLRDDWIGKASGYDVDVGVGVHHMAGGNEIDFPSRELLRPPLPSYGPAIAFGNVNVLPGNIAAPFSSVTSHVGDNTRSRACDIGTTSCSTMKFPYAPGMSCNVACSNALATTRNINVSNISPADNVGCNGPEATWFHNDDGHLAVPQSSETRVANTTTSKTCQLGPVDVEDLAKYFDPPTDGCKPPSAGSRAIYPRRSRDGQAARLDQPQEYRRDLDFRDLPSCDLMSSDLTPSHLRTCDMGPNTLGYCDLEYGDLRLRDSPYDGPRFHGSRFCDPSIGDPRFCGVRLCEEQQPRELGHDLGRGDPGPSNWFCNDCPELFNFCSEERWLQCPASDRCPLYDTSYPYGTLVLPPCMYENGYSDNDNWHYGYVEDEQLLEDYL